MDIQPHKPYKILLIGETCLDVYMYGKCKRLSPEAAVPVLDMTHQETKPGMSANVRENLIGLGCHVSHVTNEREITKTRIVDSRFNHHIVRVDSTDTIDTLDNIFLEQVREGHADEKFDAIVISDYDKGFLRYEYVTRLLSFFKELWPDIPVFVDTKKKNADCFDSVILKVNYSEFTNMISEPTNSKTIVTCGRRGAKHNGEIFPAFDTEVYDVVGAGDTFLAGLVYMYLNTSGDMRTSIKFANKCASIAVRRFGTHSITMNEVTSV